MGKAKGNGGNGDGVSMSEMRVHELLDFIKAGFSHFWVYTLQPRYAEKKIIELLKQYTTNDGDQYKPLLWDATSEQDIVGMLTSSFDLPRFSAVICRNFHFFVEREDPNRPVTIQYVQNQVTDFQAKETRRLFFAISSSRDIPTELARDFQLWEYGLPTDDDLGEALDLICESVQMPQITGKERERLIIAARCLTYEESKNAYSLALVRTKKAEGKARLDAEIVSQQRANMVKTVTNDAVVMGEYKQTFADIIGNDNLKTFLLKMVPNPKAKGVVIVGPSGTGKSEMAKALSNEVGIPVLVFSFDKVYQKYYGESEKIVHAAIAIFLAFGRCILFVDELEKGMSGASSGGEVEGRDVERRVGGAWLKFLSDRPDGIFVMATVNKIDAIDPEYLRSERWDCVAYIGMPDDAQLKAIAKHYLNHYELPAKAALPDMKGWTGADVKTMCRLASSMGVTPLEAAEFVTPTGIIKKAEIAALERRKGEFVDANKAAVNKVIQAAKKTNGFRTVDV